VSEQKIQIKNLYKIFGNNAEGVMDLVNDGISKQELLEDHGHVLGLRDINIDVPEKVYSSNHGFVRFWKINLNTAYKPAY